MSICRRGYRGVFWDIFVREKCTRGGRVEVSRNYLLTDWEGQKVVVLAANRICIDGIIRNYLELKINKILR